MLVLINRLLSAMVCVVVGHSPIVEIQGRDSNLVCERCRKVLSVFVTNIFRDPTPPRSGSAL